MNNCIGRLFSEATAQRCYCGSANCRGYLGVGKQVNKHQQSPRSNSACEFLCDVNTQYSMHGAVFAYTHTYTHIHIHTHIYTHAHAHTCTLTAVMV